MRSNPGVLVLEKDSELVEFPGYLFGASVSTEHYENFLEKKEGRDQGFGEVVFNTSMTGYQEILTDPSYFGQLVCMTAAHIGNTGVNSVDIESRKPWCSAFIISQFTERSSNWRAESELATYLKENQIPGIHSVDTRALTLELRTRGVTRGILLPLSERENARDLLKRLPPFEGRDLINEVTTKEPFVWNQDSQKQSKYKVVAMDFGIKWNLLRHLDQRGCEVEVVSAGTTAQEILSKNPDGVFLSNGPGDPRMAPYAIETVRELVGKKPIFGVCMGHQILALALGGEAFKLKFGHRGGNQPVMNQERKAVEISSQNHGYAIDPETLPKEVEASHVNLNDGTLEGLISREKRAFSVQYHPEASPGPHDSTNLFDRFIDLMQESP